MLLKSHLKSQNNIIFKPYKLAAQRHAAKVGRRIMEELKRIEIQLVVQSYNFDASSFAPDKWELVITY